MVASMVRVADYQILEQIYAGSRTLIYRARRQSDARSVVIKLLRSEHPSFIELAQFRNQYTIAKALDLPEIIQTYALEPYKNSYALVMEDFGGISLSEAIAQSATAGLSPAGMELEVFLQIALQVVAALAGLHRHGIIHKDIKPANILLHPLTQQVKLIDFSIAACQPRTAQLLTHPQGLEGTLAYLSPEQTGRMNRGVDYRADFYALGVTFYQLLTGQLPFQSTDPIELVHCHLAKQPLEITHLNPKIPSGLAAIIRKLMAKNAEDRYQSALGLKHDLTICQQQLQQSGQITAFELGSRDLSDRLTISEKLYGRELEIATLMAAFERVSNGSRELLLVAGFSGVGKTAMVNEVHKPIARNAQFARAQSYFIQGKFDQFQRHVPFSAIVQAFRDLVTQLLKENQPQIDRWQAKILAAVGDNGQVITDLIPEIALLIGPQPEVAALEAIGAQNRLHWVFQKFIQVFSTPVQPLVIFLDDLQWADTASLKLIQSLMQEPDIGHLLLIGAYRDHEVSLVHPLIQTVQELQSCITVNTIVLAPLSLADLNQLIADTLHCSVETATSLAQWVFTKTKGNPFLSNQFLKTLSERQLITFNFATGTWQWQIEQIRALSLTDDVVEFMAAQLQQLPAPTQAALKLAACMGNQFDLTTLAIVSDKSPSQTVTDLWAALQAGLILTSSENYQLVLAEVSPTQPDTETLLPLSSMPFQFLHDRVQQAAYSLIPADQKSTTHWQIGRLLLAHIPAADREAKIFAIVNQLNYGVALLCQAAERNELAQLNLIAAQKAIATTAYAMAADYATIGIQLLPDNSWQKQYYLTLALYEAAIAATSLCGAFEPMAEFAAVVLQQARTLLDRAKTYEIVIQAYTSQNKLLEAIAIAREALQQFKITLPDQPSEADIQQAFRATALQLEGTAISDLMNLPLMLAADQLAVMRIAANLIPPAFIAAPNLFPLVILLQVNLSIQYGNTPLSAFSYANYSLLLGSALQDFEAAAQFGELAFNLVAKFNAPDIKARVYYVLAAFVVHGKAHIRETLPLLLDSYQTSLETGNLEFVGYGAKEICQHAYFVGQELTALEAEMSAYSQTLANLKQSTSLTYCYIYWQATLNLLGRSEDPCILSGEVLNEATLLPSLLAANDISGLHYFYLHKLILCYLFEDFEQAIELIANAAPYLAGGTGFITVPILNFYDSLTALAVYAARPREQTALLERVTKNQAQLGQLAHYAPMNYLHKYELVAAEQHRVLGHPIAAIEAYDRAIEQAREQDYLNDEAIACELAAKFYLAWGKITIARAYMINAYQAYQRWGAKVKLADLAHRYPQLLTSVLRQETTGLEPVERDCKPAEPASFATLATLTHDLSVSGTTTLTSSSSVSEALDFATVLKASQALSGEIHLEKLLSTLMQVVIENAGAQTGALLLYQAGELVMQAQASRRDLIDEPLHITAVQAVPLQTCSTLPMSLINYVSRTLKTFVIDDALADTNFADDPYIYQAQPKSVLCTAICKQGKLIGILYLENNLTRGAFTRDRLQVLKLLTTQAAISLENALLYESLEAANSTLEQRVIARTQDLNQKTQHLEQTLQKLQHTQAQLVQAEKMSGLGQLVAGIAHEINNPVNFISGNLSHTHNYVQDLLQLIAAYQQEYPQPGTAVAAVAERIDLEFLIEDLPKLLNSMQVGSDRIRSIVAGLRNFSRLDEAEMKFVNLHEGIESALMILQHRFKAKSDSPGIEIIREYSLLPQVECHAGQLNQVFMNIFSNAIDAIVDRRKQRPKQSLPAQIRIWTEQLDPQWVQVRIADNGAGMPPEIQQKIFDPFFTTKPIGSGTGLGLSITYQIVVEKHQGRLTCQSTPEQGTEFTIAIPLHKQPQLPQGC